MRQPDAFTCLELTCIFVSYLSAYRPLKLRKDRLLVAIMLEEQSYIPRFESANTSIEFVDDEQEAEDSDNDTTIDNSGNKTAPKSTGSKRKSVSKATNDNDEVGDKRKLAHGKGKRKIEIGE